MLKKLGTVSEHIFRLRDRFAWKQTLFTFAALIGGALTVSFGQFFWGGTPQEKGAVATLQKKKRLPLSALLRPGEKAITIPVPPFAPFIEPGDQVDLVSLSAGGPGKILVRHQTVLEVREEEGGKFLTLALPSKEALNILPTLQEGSFGLLLSSEKGDRALPRTKKKERKPVPLKVLHGTLITE